MRALVTACLILFGATAQAVPVTWYFQDVVFSDGATATGSFTFDSDPEGNADQYSNFDIVTTDTDGGGPSAQFTFREPVFQPGWREPNASEGATLNGWHYVSEEGYGFSASELKADYTLVSSDYYLASSTQFGVTADYNCESYSGYECSFIGGLPLMQMNFGTALTDEGGTAEIVYGVESRCFAGDESGSCGGWWTTNENSSLSYRESARSIVSGYVTTVPLPPAVWLLGSALGALGWWRRPVA